jgi:proteasome lid subunit RPN8/RPN11
MSYYIRLRLSQAEAPVPAYERDLPFRAVEPLVQQVFAQLVQRGDLERNAAVRAVLAVPAGVLELRTASDGWDTASPTEISWLRVLAPPDYEQGKPIQNLVLYVTVMSANGAPEKTLRLPLPTKVFDSWFKFASSLVASPGRADENLRREVALCQGNIDQERERFPLLDDEMLEIGGEVERYDIQDLLQRTPPQAKRELRVLSTTEEESTRLFIRQAVLRQIEKAAAASPDFEIGGLLVGEAYRDTSPKRLFMEIHGHLPALASIAERESMMFSHEDNLRFTEAMQTQYKKYRTLGWYHTHPQAPFLSDPDRRFHEASWRAPWHVALVLGYAGQIKLFFHWNGGRLAPLSSFYIY